jgi:hypothetical protein
MRHIAAYLATAMTATLLALTVRSSVPEHYGVLPALSEANLAVYMVEGDYSNDTSHFLTLDEGLTMREVEVTEISVSDGFTYRLPPPSDDGVWRERPFEPPRVHSLVNQVHIANLSRRPLLVISGEVVVGGKQDRVIAHDRILAPESGADVEVFCVEPHRWEGSSRFRVAPVIAQPSLRSRVLEGATQSEVWDSVRVAQDAFAHDSAVTSPQPAEAPRWSGTSSYAGALHDPFVDGRIDQIVRSLSAQYQRLRSRIPHPRIQGVVVALNGEPVWSDNFASPELFDRYWPKLARSYAAEALTSHVTNAQGKTPLSMQAVMRFLTDISGQVVRNEGEPGLYHFTQINRSGFQVSILTSDVAGAAFDVHRSKAPVHFDR